MTDVFAIILLPVLCTILFSKSPCSYEFRFSCRWLIGDQYLQCGGLQHIYALYLLVCNEKSLKSRSFKGSATLKNLEKSYLTWWIYGRLHRQHISLISCFSTRQRVDSWRWTGFWNAQKLLSRWQLNSTLILKFRQSTWDLMQIHARLGEVILINRANLSRSDWITIAGTSWMLILVDDVRAKTTRSPYLRPTIATQRYTSVDYILLNALTEDCVEH